MPGKVTYQNLYTLVKREIAKSLEFRNTDKFGQQSTRTAIEPYFLQPGKSDGVVITEVVQAIQQVLQFSLEGRVIEGLNVTATDPTSNQVTVSAGKGTGAGQLFELLEDVDITIPFDDTTETFFLNINQNTVQIDNREDTSKLKIAKVVVPVPGTTNKVKDNEADDDPNDAYIVNFLEYKLLGDANGRFEEDTLEFFRDNIGLILADNLIGNIKLSEDLKIINTQGSVEIDSKSVNIIDTNDNIIAQFNREGTFFFDTNGVELAKFSVDGAKIGNIIINTDSIQSGNFVSGALGSGFQIADSGNAEFNNVLIRGKISSTIFEKASISTVGGNLLIMDGDILTSPMTSSDSSNLTIEGDTTFTVGDILRIKDGANDEWLEITDISSAPTYVVTRDKDSTYSSNDNPTWGAGTTVVNYKQSGDGSIFMTASESNAPYLSVITHTGSPWSSQTTSLRLGNLNGFLGYSEDKYGIAIGEATKYLKYDATNGLRVAGHTLLGSLEISTNGFIASGQTAYNTGTGFYLEHNSGTPRFSIGDTTTNSLTWDGTTLSIRGSLNADDIIAGSLSADRITGGTLTGTTIEGNTIQTSASGSRIVMTEDSFIAYDDASGGGNEVFRINMTGSGGIIGDVIFGNYSGGNGAKWDNSAGTFDVQGEINASSGNFSGTITVGSAGNVVIDGANEVIKIFSDTVTIVAGSNDDLDWTEDGSPLTADLDAGEYTPAEMATELQSEMRAVGDSNTTVTYNSTTRLFTITNATLSTLTFLFLSGDNNSTTCGQAIGFSILVDKTGALTYDSDEPYALRVKLGKLS